MLTRYLIAGLVAVLALVGTYVYGRHDGAAIERAEWAKRANLELEQANAELQRAHARVREAERTAAERLAQVSGEYQGELSNVRKENAKLRDAVRRGELRLRDPGARSGATCADRPAETAAPAGRRDGAAAGELSEQATQFLLDLTAEADELVKQLTACQAVVLADRATPVSLAPGESR